MPDIIALMALAISRREKGVARNNHRYNDIIDRRKRRSAFDPLSPNVHENDVRPPIV